MKFISNRLSISAISLVCSLNIFSNLAIAGDFVVRKNVVDLTSKEKTDLVDAIKTLKTTIPEGSEISVYDQFVGVHLGAMSLARKNGAMEMPKFNQDFDIAHGNSAFLPWHREYILRFEKALQSVNSNVTLPYWDWTQPEAVDTIFKKDFLGINGEGVTIDIAGGIPGNIPSDIPDIDNVPPGNIPNNIPSDIPNNIAFGGGLVVEGGPVVSGNFSEAEGWVLNEKINIDRDTRQSLGTSLVRFLGQFPASDYPLPQEQIDKVLALDDYLLFRPALEGYITVDEDGNVTRGGFTHNYMHSYVGGAIIDDSDLENIQFKGLGTMSNVPSSPYDPIFWLHHANVDRIWAEWQENGHSGTEYYPESGQPEGHNLNDKMWPWDGGKLLAETEDLQGLLSLLPEFEPGDVIRPIDVLDHTKLGYNYDTLQNSPQPEKVPEPTSILAFTSIAALLAVAKKQRAVLAKHVR
ncbi:tyrosinase family protein [Rivularia sp. PCC 7116]|uniref:tyrosinase family protein n=1 Tax=Rivularia sp. PCC 7116 TaxID=373994 RepID=UPI00029F05CC|nr:tyrosinase family protein [Rivularia sp. PCC 7116]AFY54422.1 tyrosinase family protein [Rivularia sp. PCC 7116]